MSARGIIADSTTTIEYPKSGRKVVIDSKGNVISDTNNKNSQNKHGERG